VIFSPASPHKLHDHAINQTSKFCKRDPLFFVCKRWYKRKLTLREGQFPLYQQLGEAHPDPCQEDHETKVRKWKSEKNQYALRNQHIGYHHVSYEGTGPATPMPRDHKYHYFFRFLQKGRTFTSKSGKARKTQANFFI
jgi:hypothetical protein